MSTVVRRIGEVRLPTPERPRSDSLPPPRRNRSALILLIDPRPLTRECLSHLLQVSARDFRIVPVSDPAEVSENGALSGGADLIVLNTGGDRVTKGSVGQAISLLHRTLPDTPLVVLSDRDGAEHVAEAIRRGARGYIPTSLPLPAAIEALRFVCAGGTFVPASAVVRPVQREQRTGDVKPPGDAGAVSVDRFTARELEVLTLLQQGKPNKIIAYELHMQETTVKVHIRHIKHKLGVTNRVQAALLCQQVFESQDGPENGENSSSQAGPVDQPGRGLRSIEVDN